MEETSVYNDSFIKDQFKIDYPYYGLFGTALVTPVYEEGEITFRCRLLNGTTIFLKKLFQSKWIDAALNDETSLSKVMGLSIDDFLKIKKGA
jgi:hypothetical protein